MAVETVISNLESSPDLLKTNWCVSHQTGRLLYLLAMMVNAKSICEVGTSIGYSTLWLAKAAQHNGGRVITLDYFESRQGQAKVNIDAANLSSVVSFRQGQALDLLKQLKEDHGQFDFAFVDAAKAEYLEYVKLLEAMMPSGGILVADNTRSHREEMADFLHYMDHSDAFDLAEIETGSGQLVARKR